MSDLGSLIRQHYEEIAPPIEVDQLADQLLTEERLQPTPSRARGVLIAVAAALVVLFVVGGTTLFVQLNRGEEVIEEPSTTTTLPSTTTSPPSTTLPDDPPPDAGPDESVLPAIGAVSLPFTVLDREGDAGAGASVIVTSDGIPIVAYAYHPIEEGVASEIRLATCADAECSAPGTVVTIAEIHQPSEPPGEGAPVGVEIGALLPEDGLPIVIWSEWDDVEDGGESYLKAYKCSDPTCSDGTLVTVAEQLGSGLWVAVGPDSLPVVAQRQGDWEDLTIHLTKCTDPGCSGTYDTSVVDFPGLDWNFAMTVDSEDHPLFTIEVKGQQDGANYGPTSLAMARCLDPMCEEEPVVVDLGVEGAAPSAVALDSGGNPVTLAALHDPNGEGDSIVLIACTDPVCSTEPTVTTLGNMPIEGEINAVGSLALSNTDQVAVAIKNGRDIDVVTCADPLCSGEPSAVSVLPGLGWSEMSFAISPTGRPLMAIHTNTDLGVFVCSEPTCLADQVQPISDAPESKWIATIAAPADVSFNGMNPSIEISPSGYPVIGYAGRSTSRGPQGEPITAPKLMICNDAGCATSTTRELADDAWWVSMTVLPDGRPVAVYSAWTEDWETEELLIAWCEDLECSSWTTEKIAESGWLNSTVALAAHTDGSVSVVYQDSDDYYVYLVSCSEGACEGTDPVKIDSLVDPNDTEWGLRWWMNTLDIALLADGRPVIAASQDNGELRYVECLDAACSESQRILIDRTHDANGTIEVGSGGMPILAHHDDGELTVTACHDTGCLDVTTTPIGEAMATSIGAVTPSIAFGIDGNPMITHWAPRALMLVECHDAMCAESTADVFANVRTYDLAVLPNGSPVIAYFAYSDEEPPPGQEEFGELVDLRVAECTIGTCVGG